MTKKGLFLFTSRQTLQGLCQGSLVLLATLVCCSSAQAEERCPFELSKRLEHPTVRDTIQIPFAELGLTLDEVFVPTAARLDSPASYRCLFHVLTSTSNEIAGLSKPFLFVFSGLSPPTGIV